MKLRMFKHYYTDGSCSWQIRPMPKTKSPKNWWGTVLDTQELQWFLKQLYKESKSRR